MCAVVRRRFSVGASPTRQLSLQPEATGAVLGILDVKLWAAKTAAKAVGGKVDALYFAFGGMPH